MSVWQVEKKGLVVGDVVSTHSGKEKDVRVGQDVMHVMLCLHVSMEREAAGVAQT